MNEIMLGGRRVRGFGLGGEGTPPAPPNNNMVAGAMVGAGVTAFGSLLVSALAGGVRWPVVAAMTVGGGAVGALVGSKQAAAATKLPALTVTVSDPPVIQAITASPGTTVTLQLPPGATWQNVSVGTPGNEFLGNMVQQGSSAPVSVTVPPVPGATIDANWTTSDGKTHFQAIVALPPGATLATPVTDAAAVTAVQSTMNSISSQAATAIGLQPVPVNGNAADPAFVAQLAKVQGFLNAQFAKMGRPVNLRSDGTLDYGTYSIFSVPL